MELALAALALALAVGTKGTAAFALPALALFVLSSQPRRRWWSLVALGPSASPSARSGSSVNLVEAGRRSPAERASNRGADPLGERIWRSRRGSPRAVRRRQHGAPCVAALGLSGRWRVALVVALVLSADGVAWRQASRSSSGQSPSSLAPMLVTWVAARGSCCSPTRRTRSGSDVGDPPERLPEGFYESPMHSSYGLAFVILFFGAGALVVVDVVRRQRPVAALAALCGVPLTLLVTALVLGYDPQRMRYIVFAVALAAAVFGVALRVRALAWTAVAADRRLGHGLGRLLHSAARRPRAAAREPHPARCRRAGSSRPGAATETRRRSASSKSGSRPTRRSRSTSLTNTYIYPAWDAAACAARSLFVPRDGDGAARRRLARRRAVRRTVDETRLDGRRLERSSSPPARVGGSTVARVSSMCRNIKTLHNFEPPATEDEIRAAALQYVRKVSGSQKPSKANEAAFARAVAEVAHVTNAAARDARHERAAARPRGRGRARPRSRREALRPRRLALARRCISACEALENVLKRHGVVPIRTREAQSWRPGSRTGGFRGRRAG